MIELFANAIEDLREDNIDQLTAIYADNAVFVHPIKTVQGKKAIARQWKMMFKYCPYTIIRVTNITLHNGTYTAHWIHTFAPRGNESVSIAGTSTVIMVDNLVIHQTDEFDVDLFHSLFA
jgi:ketosteroid isomerase-like protein